MQDKILKIISIIIIFIVIISVFPNKVSADWADDAESFLKAQYGEDKQKDTQEEIDAGTGDDINIGINPDKLNEASSDIYNTLTSIGMVISVIVGLILGINFMMASAEDKAKVKEALMPYVVGCIVIFGAFGIWKLVINTFNGL